MKSNAQKFFVFLFIDWLIPFDELKSLNWEARISTKWNTWTNTA